MKHAGILALFLLGCGASDRPPPTDPDEVGPCAPTDGEATSDEPGCAPPPEASD